MHYYIWTVCSLLFTIHCLCTVYHVFTMYSLCIHRVFTLNSLCTHCHIKHEGVPRTLFSMVLINAASFTVYSLYIHLYSLCSLHSLSIHCLFIVYSLSIHCLPMCALSSGSETLFPDSHECAHVEGRTHIRTHKRTHTHTTQTTRRHRHTHTYTQHDEIVTKSRMREKSPNRNKYSDKYSDE
jgi:hypothetical protein